MKRWKLLAVMLAAAGVLSLVLVPERTSAIGLKYFDDDGATCDVEDCAATAVRMVVGQTRYVQQSGVNAYAYFTSPSGGTLTVFGYNWCPTSNGLRDNLQSGDALDGRSITDGTDVTRYEVTGGATTTVFRGEKFDVGDAQCDAARTITFTNLPAHPSIGGLYYATINVVHSDRVAGTCAGGSVAGCDGIQNQFYLVAGGTGPRAISHAAGGTGYEVTMNQYQGPDNIDIFVRFGSDCSVPAGGSVRNMHYYDLDNAPGVSGNAQQNGLITMELYENGVRVMGPWTPADQQNVRQSRSYNFKPDKDYTWILRNVYKNNTVQFSTPFDGIYYEYTCPTVTPPPCPWNPALPASDPLCVPPPPPDKAYFQVLGGDLVAGVSIATDAGTPCSGAGAAPHIPAAGISSWNRANSDGTYRGAGSEYAAQALNFIQGLVTGQGNNATAPLNQEKGELAFANDNTAGSYNPTGGLFGGKYGDAPCIDYWNSKPPLTNAVTTNPLDLNSLPSGNYHYNGNLTVSGTTIGQGKRINLYVTGNVAVAGNVTYPPAAVYPNRNAIPALRLVAKGSIFINRGVGQLDGLYAAIPDTGATSTSNAFNSPIPGTVSTCSSGFSTFRPSDPAIFNQCRVRLTVNGSLVGHQVWLLRTFGELDTFTPAEVINYTPEIWLAPSDSQTMGDYTSVKGLPPVL